MDQFVQTTPGLPESPTTKDSVEEGPTEETPSFSVWFWDNIADITSVFLILALAVFLLFKPDLTSKDLNIIIGGILTILSLLVMSNLALRHRELKRIEKLSKRVNNLIWKKMPDAVSSKIFLKQYIDSKELNSFFLNGQNICLCGFTLTDIISTYEYQLSQSLMKGHVIKIILPDPKSESTMQNMANRSLSEKGDERKFWEKKIEDSVASLNRISDDSGTTNKIIIEYLPYLPSFNLMFDNLGIVTRDKCTCYVQLTPHKTTKRKATFKLNNEKDLDWFEYYKDQWDELWKSALENKKTKTAN